MKQISKSDRRVYNKTRSRIEVLRPQAATPVFNPKESAADKLANEIRRLWLDERHRDDTH